MKGTADPGEGKGDLRAGRVNCEPAISRAGTCGDQPIH